MLTVWKSARGKSKGVMKVTEETAKISLKISADDILDPQARWTCQRLDKLYTILMDLTTEVREMNSVLKDIRTCVLQDYPKVKDSDFEDSLL